MPEGGPMRRGPHGVRAWTAPGVRLADVLPPAGDPDQWLTKPQCDLVKFQPKVTLGRVTTPAGTFFIKRYNVASLAGAVRFLGRASPARRAWAAAAAVAARGVATPVAVACVERRRAGLLLASFFVTRAVEDAVTSDVAWQRLAHGDGATARAARRQFAADLGRFYRTVHEAGISHRDLKDVNVLVRADGSFVLLDLEDVRVVDAPIGEGARRTNLMQLARTLGRVVSAPYRLRFLRAYLGDDAEPSALRSWASAIDAAVAAKDQRRAPRREPEHWQTVTCTIVCQDEADQIAGCLASVAWCHEIVVIDGGSHDATPKIAAAAGARVITNPWPGYRAQKQFALDHATSVWVLNLDADERVTDELATEIRAALATVSDDVDGFLIPRLVAYFGRWWYRGGWYPRPIVRLVRRTRTTWGGTDPHDRAEVPGKVVALRNPIVHYTYADVHDHLRSVDKLTAVAASQVSPRRRVGLGRLVAEPVWRFFRSLVVNRGAAEGVPGIFVAITDAFYTFLRFARVWAARRGQRS